MKILYRNEADFESQLGAMLRRAAFSPEIEEAAAAILDDVAARGDTALVEYAARFDHVSLTPEQFAVSAAEMDAAASRICAQTRDAIDLAVGNIRDFSRRRLPQDWSYSPRPGVVLGEQFHPLDRVGCYVPGGTAPLISTVCHTVTLAAVAGVPQIIVCTPPAVDGSVNPAILYACRKAGATAVYRLGGVYAIGAMAYGTASIPQVEKICGPGNAFVAAAKRRVYGSVALDLVAGPSEVMIIADDNANPAFIAADILAQAEHGSGREQAVLVSTSRELLRRTEREVLRQSAMLKRQFCIPKVLENGVFLVEARDLEEAARIAGKYAPEHLELHVANPEALAPQIKAAGAIFLGEWTPEPVGDFVAGPSHVLPTGGTGKYFNGLTADSFFRRTSLVKYGHEALEKELPALEQFAACEGLDGHGRSGTIRRDGAEAAGGRI